MTFAPPISGTPHRRSTDETYPFRPAKPGALAELYWTTPASTTIGVAATYVKAAGTTTLGGDPAPTFIESPSNNRLTYVGTGPIRTLVSFNGSATCASDNQLLGFCLARNGLSGNYSRVQCRYQTGAEAFAIQGLFTLSNSDYLEVWLTNTTSTAAVTIGFGNLSIVEVP